MFQRIKDGIGIVLAVIVIALLANSCNAKDHKYEEGLKEEGYNEGYRIGYGEGYDQGYADASQLYGDEE